MTSNDRIAPSLIRKTAIPVLLYAGFALQGMKSPQTFFIWATLALFYCVIVFTVDGQDYRRASFAIEWTVLIGVLLSFLFSRDRSVSAFQTLQILTFLALWCALKRDPEIVGDADDFWMRIAILSAASALWSFVQYRQGPFAWGCADGFFPINPGFNAYWLGATGLALIVQAWQGRRLLIFAAAILDLAAVAAGPSRSALIAVTAGAFYLLFQWLTLRRAAYLTIALLISFILVPKRTIDQRLRLNEGNYRTAIWKIAFHAIKDHPFVGYGLGNFEIPYQRYAFPVESDSIRFARVTSFAHNEYLQAAADLGLPTALLLSALLFILLCRKTTALAPERAGLLVMAVGAFQNIVWHLPFLIFLTLVFCALLRRRLIQREGLGATNEMPDRRLSKPIAAVAVACLWLLCGREAIRQVWADQGRWSRIVRWMPGDSMAWYERGLALDLPSERLASFEQAVALAPENVYYREALANAREASSPPDLRGAFLDYTAALQWAPNRALDAVSAARVCFRARRYQEALYFAEWARRSEPNYWEASLWIARCDNALGDSKRAVFILQALRNRRSNYLRSRLRRSVDMPTSNGPAAYDQTVLAYDDRVIQRELAHIQLKRTGHE